MDTKTPTPETPTPETPTPPKGVAICDNFNEFSQIAEIYGDNPRLIAAVRRFFEYTAKMDAIDKASTNAADRAEAVKDAARTNPGAMIMNEAAFLQYLEYSPTDGAVVDGDAAVDGDADTPPVLIDKTPKNINFYLTGLVNPLVSAKYAREAATIDANTDKMRTFCDLSAQEIEALNFVIVRAMPNLKIQKQRLKNGLLPLIQCGNFTFTDFLNAFGYGKYADVNDKIAAAFDTLATETFLFFDEVEGKAKTVKILEFEIDFKSKIKTYTINQAFLNTLSAIEACLVYYNLKDLAEKNKDPNRKKDVTVGSLAKYRGDRRILFMCLQLLFELQYYGGKPFYYSNLEKRAWVKGLELKKNKDWKRAIKQAFAFLGLDVIEGKNGDKFIVKRKQTLTEKTTD